MSQKKFRKALFTSKKNEETETKRVLGDMKIPKREEIFTVVLIVCHRYERLAALQMCARSFYFEQVKALKSVWEKLCAS